MAVGLGLIGGGGGGPGGAGGAEGGGAGGAAAEAGSNGGPAVQGSSAPAAQPRKRSSWVPVPSVPGRRRSIEPVRAYTICDSKQVSAFHMLSTSQNVFMYNSRTIIRDEYSLFPVNRSTTKPANRFAFVCRRTRAAYRRNASPWVGNQKHWLAKRKRQRVCEKNYDMRAFTSFVSSCLRFSKTLTRCTTKANRATTAYPAPPLASRQQSTLMSRQRRGDTSSKTPASWR